MRQEGSPDGRIVVGADGSRSSQAALQWALRQAELTGSAVEVVTAWHHPLIGGGYAPISVLDPADVSELAAKQLSAAVAEVADPSSSVEVRASVQEGNAAQALLTAAKGAELLVVGSRTAPQADRRDLLPAPTVCFSQPNWAATILPEPAKSPKTGR